MVDGKIRRAISPYNGHRRHNHCQFCNIGSAAHERAEWARWKIYTKNKEENRMYTSSVFHGWWQSAVCHSRISARYALCSSWSSLTSCALCSPTVRTPPGERVVPVAGNFPLPSTAAPRSFCMCLCWLIGRLRTWMGLYTGAEQGKFLDPSQLKMVHRWDCFSWKFCAHKFFNCNNYFSSPFYCYI